MQRLPILVFLMLSAATLSAAEPVAIGTRRELFVDDALVERLAGRAKFRLQQPTPRDVTLVTGEPWEGNATNYVTVFQEDDKSACITVAATHRISKEKDRPSTRNLYCYAESPDGIHWTKPELGIFAWDGLAQNLES